MAKTVRKPLPKSAGPMTGAEPQTETAAKKYADDDYSIDARMWRLEQDHIRMGVRPK